MFRIKFHLLVLTMKCRSDYLAAELKQVGADLATGERQGIESIEIDVRSD
jgi:hypothetical protein